MTPGHAPPASPLLEAYQGTYQSMRSPLLMPHFDDDLDDLPPLSHYDSHKSKKKSRRVRHADQDDSSSSSSEKARKKTERRSSSETKIKIKSSLKAPKSRSNKTSYSHTDSKPARSPSGRRVTMYDAERDAKTIAEALSHTRPDMEPLVEILPLLSHDQVMELRAAYKKVCKIQGRGINIAKHVKMKTSGPLGKLLYVLALGRWESEGYWANFWYNSNSSRRELLIEALMGRTNQEIKLIKADFQDKRYDDSLVKCMDKELKADKFRTAVLQALEEKRQEESEVWPLEYRNRDVDALREALRRKEGGETALLVIVVTRSDAHLRDVLRTYERKFGSNFAKDALKKSNNLVVSSAFPLSPRGNPRHNLGVETCLSGVEDYVRTVSVLTTRQQRTGRDRGAHTQRRHQPPRARRAPAQPRADGPLLGRRGRDQGAGPRRAAHLQAGAHALGQGAVPADQAGVQGQVQAPPRGRCRKVRPGRGHEGGLSESLRGFLMGDCFVGWVRLEG